MDKKKMAVASLTLSLVSLIPVVISPNSLTGALIFCIVGIFLGIIGVVLGFLGKSASKGLAISGIIIGIVSCLILCVALVGFAGMANSTDCVDNGDGTATCDFMGEKIEIPTDMLREDQMKK